jgi:hypothetical protein
LGSGSSRCFCAHAKVANTKKRTAAEILIGFMVASFRATLASWKPNYYPSRRTGADQTQLIARGMLNHLRGLIRKIVRDIARYGK